MVGSRSVWRLWFAFAFLVLVWLISPAVVGASSISAHGDLAMPPGLADEASQPGHEGEILRAQSLRATTSDGPTALAYDATPETGPSRIPDLERSLAPAVGLKGGVAHRAHRAGCVYDPSASFVAPNAELGTLARQLERELS